MNKQPTIDVIDSGNLSATASSAPAFLPTLLANMQEGMCMLDEDGCIRPPVSDAMFTMLDAGDLCDKPLTEVLKTRLPLQICQETEDFLPLLFDPDIEAEVLDELNPLSAVEFSYQESRQIWNNSRIFNWRFLRTIEDGICRSVLCLVTDITQVRQLAGKALKKGNESRRQLEWLAGILHLESSALSDFIEGCDRELQQVDELLARSEEKNSATVLAEIYRSIYLLRGNASLMGLEQFVTVGDKILRELQPLRGRRQPEAREFIPVVFALRDMRDLLAEMREIFSHVSEIHQKVRARRSYESELLVNSVGNLIRSLSRELSKQVTFRHDDFDAMIIPYRMRKSVRDLIYLLTRNALYYGLERPAERREKGKNPVAVLSLSTFVKDNQLGINLRHDGRINQIQDYFEKVLDAHAPTETLEDPVNDAEWASAIFMPMIAPEGEHDSGYFLDLDLLKRRVRAMRGRLKLSVTASEHCDYTITLPVSDA